MRIKPAEAFLLAITKAAKAMRLSGVFVPAKVRSILVVSSTAIGDTLLSTPAMRAVRKSYPRARIVALLNRDNMELFADNPNIDKAVPFYGGYKNFSHTLRELRGYGFDLAIVFHGNEPQTTPLCFLSGAPFVFKLPNDSKFNFLLANKTPVVKWGSLGHGIEARLETAKLAGCRGDGVRMELFLKKADFDAADAFLKKNGWQEGDTLIGLQPGASTLSRQWFPERFAALGKKLIGGFERLKIVITGSPAETGLCRKIAEGIGERVCVSAGELGLRAGAALIKRLNAFVTGDTGPMHMAYALGTPVVALYAVADPAVTGPLYDGRLHRVIKKPRTCEPCVSKKCKYQKCMEAIGVDEVFSAVAEAAGLGKPGQKRKR